MPCNGSFIICGIFLLFSEQFIEAYQIFNLKKCNGSVLTINLDLYASVVINATYTNYFAGTFFCRFVFTTKELPNYNLLIMNLQLFETMSLSPSKIYANLYFSTVSGNLFLIHFQESDLKIKNLYLTRLLSERNFKWDENLFLDVKLLSPSQTNLILVITPAYYCANTVGKDMFKCETEFQSSKICIENLYKCNGWTNCISGNNDESVITCQSQFVYHILLPSLILSCTVFLLGWGLLKMTPCIIQQRRLFAMRRNRMMMGTAGEALNSLAASTFFQELGFGFRTSETNWTPDNIPQSPPKYQNIRQTSTVEHHLPPSYSEETDIGVIPEFFKRFFGKPRLKERLKAKRRNQQNESDKPAKILDSQTDGNDGVVLTEFKSEDIEISSSLSDVITNATLTDMLWNIDPATNNLPYSLPNS